MQKTLSVSTGVSQVDVSLLMNMALVVGLFATMIDDPAATCNNMTRSKPHFLSLLELVKEDFLDMRQESVSCVVAPFWTASQPVWT